MTNIKLNIEENWDALKGEIQQKWGKLTHDEIEEIAGSYTKLKGKLKEHYGYKLSEIQEEVGDFLDSFDFDEMKENTKDHISLTKKFIISTLNEYLEGAKKKSIHAEKIVADYVYKNPFKTIGIATAVGVLASVMISRNNKS